MKRVLILSDGISGHTGVSLGLADWLADELPITTHVQQIRLRIPALSRPILRALCNSGFCNLSILKWFYQGINSIEFVDYDWVFSGGGKTSFATATLGRRYGLKNIFLGSLRGLKPSLFSAYMTMHASGEQNNIAMDIPPLRVAQTDVGTDSLAQKTPFSLFAIGGNGDGRVYEPKHSQALAELVEKVHRQTHRMCLIVTSRRTNATILSALETIKNDASIQLITADQTKPGDFLKLLRSSHDIFVTDDSFAMLCEALCTEKPVCILRAAGGSLSPHNASVQQRYLAQGYCSEMTANHDQYDEDCKGIGLT